jgi:hypothetical protein
MYGEEVCLKAVPEPRFLVEASVLSLTWRIWCWDAQPLRVSILHGLPLAVLIILCFGGRVSGGWPLVGWALPAREGTCGPFVTDEFTPGWDFF